MTLRLYKNKSDKNVVSKTITQSGSDILGTLREDCSIINPVISIQGLTDLKYLITRQLYPGSRACITFIFKTVYLKRMQIIIIR